METAQVQVPTFLTGIIIKIDYDICMDGAGPYQIKTLTGLVRLKASNKEVDATLKKAAGKRLRVTVAGYPVWSVECMYLNTYYAAPASDVAKMLNVKNFSSPVPEKGKLISKSKVLQVDSVDLSILKSNPPQLAIKAHGTVPTPGWKESQLVQYIYINPPPDGIYDFDFIAEHPEEATTQLLTPIIATLTVRSMPTGFRGVRVHASTNSKKTLLDERSSGARIKR